MIHFSVHQKINIRSWITPKLSRNKQPYKKLDSSWEKEANSPYFDELHGFTTRKEEVFRNKF